MNVIDLLVKAQVFKTKAEAFQWVISGGVKINYVKVYKEDIINPLSIQLIEIGKSKKLFFTDFLVKTLMQ